MWVNSEKVSGYSRIVTALCKEAVIQVSTEKVL